METVEREALSINEKPMLLSFFPTGRGEKPLRLVEVLSGGATVSAMKKGRGTEEYVVRIFNPLNSSTEVEVVFPVIDKEFSCLLKGNEFKTYILNTRTSAIAEADILERVIS